MKLTLLFPSRADLLLIAGAFCLATPPLAGAEQSHPAGRLYVAAVAGKASLRVGDIVAELQPRTVYPANGATVETAPAAGPEKADATYAALVYSNGTGIYLDADTRMEVQSFSQEAFTATRSDLDLEPSVSETRVFLSHGLVGLCTSKPAAGSTMVYETALGVISVQGRQVVIEATDSYTRIAVLEGQSTVRPGTGSSLQVGGQIVKAGEEAFLRAGAPDEPPSTEVVAIPAFELDRLQQIVSQACDARKSVTFDMPDAAGAEADAAAPFSSEFAGESQDGIVAVSLVPETLPIEFTVSPARKP